MPVYMIQAGEYGPVKIGTAGDVGKRLIYLQIGNHERLTLLRQFEGGAAEETRLHERFADNHLRGEWHHFCQAMMGDVGLVEIIKRSEQSPFPIDPPQREGVTDEQQQLLVELLRNADAIWQQRRKR